MGERVSWRWWEKEGIDLEAAKERAADSTETHSESEAESEVEPEEGCGGISASNGVSGSSGAERSEYPWKIKGQTDGTLRKFTK